ncbi:hypothetical protein D3C72_1070360 [compost metagenome]
MFGGVTTVLRACNEVRHLVIVSRVVNRDAVNVNRAKDVLQVSVNLRCSSLLSIWSSSINTTHVSLNAIEVGAVSITLSLVVWQNIVWFGVKARVSVLTKDFHNSVGDLRHECVDGRAQQLTSSRDAANLRVTKQVQFTLRQRGGHLSVQDLLVNLTSEELLRVLVQTFHWCSDVRDITTTSVTTCKVDCLLDSRPSLVSQLYSLLSSECTSSLAGFDVLNLRVQLPVVRISHTTYSQLRTLSVNLLLKTHPGRLLVVPSSHLLNLVSG